jgi:cell division protein ZapA
VGPELEADAGASVATTPDGVRVVIYDQEYRMRGELDPEYIRGLAEFVDGKMRSIAARTRTVDSLRTAILAALNIADEYHQLRAKHEAVTKEVDQKLGACTEVLDQILGLQPRISDPGD